MLPRTCTTALALLALAACSAEPTQPDLDGDRAAIRADQAFLEPGLPGQQPFATATIDAVTGLCRADYVTPNGLNAAVANRFAPAHSIEVRANKNRLKVTCRFTDDSGAYEDNAETGPVASCAFQAEDGTVHTDGTGRLTSANNIVDEVEGFPFGTGGNTMLQCTFEM